ncbi:ApaG domain-containing protein, partial [Ochromonadaceae sp. CCMP2298]
SSGDVSAWGAGATAANAAATAGGTGSETTAAAAGTTTTTAPKPTDPYILLAKAAAMRFKDPFFILAGQYKTASEAEDEGEMERLMGQMKVAGLPPHLQSLAPLARTAEEKIAAQLEEGVDNNESETVTENIRVKMVSYYDFKRSDPDEGKYFFWYKVVISNEGSEPVQVVARMWEIEKCKGEKEVVRGAGILASQPIISPGDVYTYQSGCPLKVYPPKGRRVLGSMSGAYTMCRGNMGQHNFAVKVSRFNFVLPPPSTVYVDEVEE